MINKTITKKKYDGRSNDFTFQWLVKNHGQEWETWRQLAEEWINNQDEGTSSKLKAIHILFDVYLASLVPFTSNLLSFFIGKNGWRAQLKNLNVLY